MPSLQETTERERDPLSYPVSYETVMALATEKRERNAAVNCILENDIWKVDIANF